MNLSQVIKKVHVAVNSEGSQTNYRNRVGIDKTSLSLFLSGKLSYVPTPILKDMGLKAVTTTNYVKDIENA